MFETLNIQLPEEMAAFVREETASRGLRGTDEYIQSLVADARARSLRAQLSQAIQEGLTTPLREFTASDWDRYRALAEGNGA